MYLQEMTLKDQEWVHLTSESEIGKQSENLVDDSYFFICIKTINLP